MALKRAEYIFLIVALVGRLTNIALHNSALFILNSLNKLYVLILEKKNY